MFKFDSEDFSYYKYEQIEEFLKIACSDVPVVTNNKKVTYFNIPCSFDIETSSFYEGDQKVGLMYVWQLGVNGYILIGRTWEDFVDTIEKLSKALDTDSEHRLLIFVHNLSFEFQFMYKYFTWKKVFAIDTHKPIYAILENGIEFRCSYLLSGYSLAKLSDQLLTYKVKKLSGDLDYSLPRHRLTTLTDEELRYCINDVKIVMAYIQEKIERGETIDKILLTKTGYVRKYCKSKCYYGFTYIKENNPNYRAYRDLMSGLTLNSQEYRQLKRAFQGGFTHANAFYSGKTLENVASYDFTSSYPYVCVSEMFPMSSSRLVRPKNQEQLDFYMKNYCCIFDVKFYGLMSKMLADNPISFGRCWQYENVTIDNGRVFSADMITTTLTNVDYSYIKAFYDWDRIEFSQFRVYQKGYLPKNLVRSILKLYQDKTTLKGVEGKEIEYLNSKEMVNSVYGCMVTDILRSNIIFDGKNWSTEAPDMEKTIEKHNRSKNRFLFYPWGVFVTAYARRNLFTGIYECGRDYIYADTDSIKILNHEKHAAYIEKYNEEVRKKIMKICKHYELDLRQFEPSTQEGVKKCLGVWDFEGVYSRFKTVGAKRYMTEKDGKLSFTVAGCNKKTAIPYLQNNFEDPFEVFTDEMTIPPEHTGKLTHTYISERVQGVLTDYQGIDCEYLSESGVHLEPCSFEMSLSKQYIDFLNGIITEYV